MTNSPLADIRDQTLLHFAIAYAPQASEWLPRVVTASYALKWRDHETVWYGFLQSAPNGTGDPTPLVVFRVEAHLLRGYTVRTDIDDAMDAAYPPST